MTGLSITDVASAAPPFSWDQATPPETEDSLRHPDPDLTVFEEA